MIVDNADYYIFTIGTAQCVNCVNMGNVSLYMGVSVRV